MAQFLIRRAEEADASAIAKTLRDSFASFSSDYTPEAFAAVTPTAGEICKRFAEGPIWVAVRKGQIAGTVSVVREPEWLYIRSMAVTPETQRFGIARALLAEIEKYAIVHGFEKLFLYTTNFSLPARRLYDQQGFKVVRETTANEWFGTPGLAMEKIIERKLENAIGS